MTDLISRAALLEAVRAGNHTTDTIIQIEEALGIKPVVVANISGGVLQGASANMAVDLYTLDFEDVPRDDPERVIDIEGTDAYYSECAALVDLGFVADVMESIGPSDA